MGTPIAGEQIEYVAHTRVGEKGQLTIPKQYRDELDLETGAPVAVLRIGEGLCQSIASVFASRGIADSDILETLPAARRRVFARRYPELAGRKSVKNRRSKNR